VITLALTWPAERDGRPGETVRARFPPGTLDAWRVSLLLAGLRGLALALQRLHRLGASHRDLTPDAIVVVGNDRFALRDLGLAATGFRPGEGPADYQAPEQAFGTRMPRPGPATDAYQLAAIAYHLITGRVPVTSGRIPPPLHPGLAETASDMIAAVLASGPASRPPIQEFRAALQPQRRPGSSHGNGK
jgi:serine/threonine protein kinase